MTGCITEVYAKVNMIHMLFLAVHCSKDFDMQTAYPYYYHIPPVNPIVDNSITEEVHDWSNRLLVNRSM